MGSAVEPPLLHRQGASRGSACLARPRRSFQGCSSTWRNAVPVYEPAELSQEHKLRPEPRRGANPHPSPSPVKERGFGSALRERWRPLARRLGSDEALGLGVAALAWPGGGAPAAPGPSTELRAGSGCVHALPLRCGVGALVLREPAPFPKGAGGGSAGWPTVLAGLPPGVYAGAPLAFAGSGGGRDYRPATSQRRRAGSRRPSRRPRFAQPYPR
jgi:hypothetical protein